MATISARVDDQLKEEADRVADAIGISLSTAINIFLKRFSVERGFPFEVIAIDKPHLTPPFDPAELDHSIKSAIADVEHSRHPDHFTYIDPVSGKLMKQQL